MRFVPESANRQDWPRLVSGAVNDAGRRLTAAEASIAALLSATDWSLLADYADDAAAAIGGVEVGDLYRTGSIIKVRVS